MHEERPLQDCVHGGVRDSSAASPTARLLELRVRPRAAGHRAPAERAAVAAMAHAPFFAAAGPQFFGLKDFLDLPNLKDLESLFEGPQYTKWRVPRDRGLPLRRPLRAALPPASAVRRKTVPAKTLQLRGDVTAEHDATSGATRPSRWRPASPTASRSSAGARTSSARRPAARSRTSRSTCTRRWARCQTKIPTEVRVSERREYELSEQGFIAPDLPQGLRQRRLLLREQHPETEDVRPTPRRERTRSSTTASGPSSRTSSSPAGSPTT